MKGRLGSGEEKCLKRNEAHHQSWLMRKVPVDWRLPNVMPFYKEGQKEDPGNHKPVTLISVSGKVMGQIILSAIMWRV